ncbi:MAG: PAS domain S-box protein, partial [Deltaproteobacteria bacterium]|nr:PAS domain S-box protein [Deltaproteobacteria bacterium]
MKSKEPKNSNANDNDIEDEYVPEYGDLTKLNTDRTILDSVGQTEIHSIISDFMDLLKTSSAIYERNGDYALGIFSSAWCRNLDSISRGHCNTNDNKEALESGKWLCHESCWTSISKLAIERKEPVDKPCSGGLHIYAVPIFVNEDCIGAINFGYGSPPDNQLEMKPIAERYNVPTEKLLELSRTTKVLDSETIELAKKRLHTSALLIGKIVQTRQIEKKLHESEEKYRLLYTAMDQGLALHEIITDENGKPVDYVFLDINDSYTKILGINREMSIGKRIKEVMPDVEQYWIDIFGKVALTGESSYYENYLKTTDRFYSTYSYCPKKNHFAVLVNDITDRKLAEEAVAAEKERLAVTLRSIGDGVITTDTAGNVVIINKVAEKLCGWKQEEALGKPLGTVFNIINENTRQPHENPVEKVLASGEIIELANHTLLIARDGTERIIEDSGAPIKNKESMTIGVVLVFRDMTEKQKLNHTMQRAQKLESLGILAGGIAHDFN